MGEPLQLPSASYLLREHPAGLVGPGTSQQRHALLHLGAGPSRPPGRAVLQSAVMRAIPGLITARCRTGLPRPAAHRVHECMDGVQMGANLFGQALLAVVLQRRPKELVLRELWLVLPDPGSGPRCWGEECSASSIPQGRSPAGRTEKGTRQDAGVKLPGPHAGECFFSEGRVDAMGQHEG